VKFFELRTRLIAPLVVFCCFVFFGTHSAHAATCTVLTDGARHAATTPTVVMLRSTVSVQPGSTAGAGETSDCSSLEAAQAMAAPLGLNVEIDDDATWGAKTQSDFASYSAIVLGDPGCVYTAAPITQAENTAGTWGPAITGDVALVGTDPVFHFVNGLGSPADKAQLTQNAIAYATSVSGKTGAYICLSCYYAFASASTSVPVLSPFGSFTVQGTDWDDSTIVAVGNALVNTPNTLTSAGLSNWNSASHEGFNSLPGTFTAVVTTQQTPTSSPILPYILTGQNTSASQVQSTPAPTNPTTDTPVSTVYSSTASLHVESVVIVPPSGSLSFPTGSDPATLHFLSTNRIVSDARPYTGGMSFAIIVPFDHAGNDAIQGTTGNGSKYEVRCSDAKNPTPTETDCPSPNAPGVHIRHKDIFALRTDAMGKKIQPTICTPGVACGTTASDMHYFPHTAASVPAWSPSSMIPHPACPSMITSTFQCDVEDSLVNLFGDPIGYGSDLKKGDYFLGYNVPMLLSAVKVTGANGTTSVNMPGIQGSSPFFFRSPLTFDFNVTPAQLPSGLAQNFISLMRNNNVVTVTMSVVPAAWVNGTPLTINPNDTADFPPLCAVISNVTSTTFQYAQSGSNLTGSPAGGTASNTNCWVAAPVSNLFYAFTSLAGAPDYPGITDLNDLTNCFANSTTCPATNGTTPGASSTANVEFTTTPAMPAIDGQYLLQWGAADTLKTRERYITIIPTGSPTPCPNPFGDVPAPAQPCYSTKLFNAQIFVDNTPPTVTGLTFSPNTAVPGQTITANYTCADPTVNNVASGLSSCGANPANQSLGGVLGPLALNETFTVPTGLTGPQTYTVNAKDVVGNSGSATGTYFACHYVALGINPSTVTRPALITVTGTIMDCVPTAQTVQVKFTLSGPLGFNCSTSSTVMFTTPRFTIQPGTSKSTSFQFPILTNVCAGLYTVTTTTLKVTPTGTSTLDSTSATLLVK
jgi:hypothetical protein